jgi:V/A-type H+-transporting ATPase subunit E
MGLEQVKDDIVEEARQEADNIIEEAEEEADEIVEEAETEAQKIKEDAEQEVEQEKDALERRKISNANMKAKKQKLKAKEDKINEAFNDFRNELKSMSASDKETFVESCFDKVSFEIGSVGASEDFQDAVEAQGFEPEDLDEPGIVLMSENGERQQNFTVEKIVDNYRENHRKTVAKELFNQ